jgi:hypothetical protein
MKRARADGLGDDHDDHEDHKAVGLFRADQEIKEEEGGLDWWLPVMGSTLAVP